VLVRVPTKYGKADLTIYKKAGNAVVRVLKTRAAACEKRSVDEVAIDITPEADRLLENVSILECLFCIQLFVLFFVYVFSFTPPVKSM